MPPVIAAVAGSAVSSAIASQFVAGSIIGGILGSIGGGIVSMGIGTLLAPKARKGGGATSNTEANNVGQGILTNFRGTAEAGKIIYGKRRVAGQFYPVGTSGGGNQWFHGLYLLACHEIDGVEGIYIDDQLVTLNAAGYATGFPWQQLTGRYVTSAESLTMTDSFNGGNGAKIDCIDFDVFGAGQTGASLTVACLFQYGFPFGLSSTIISGNVIFPAGMGVLLNGELYQTTAPVVVPISFTAPTTNTFFGTFTLPLDRPLSSSPATGADVQLYKTVKQLVFARVFRGTPDQVASPLIASRLPSIWNADFRLRGVAYLEVQFEYDQTTFPDGVPNVSCVVRGKKVFDPRTGLTQYSANSALCLRDYLTDSLGFGATSAEIDDTSFIAAANVCDENVTLASGATQKRYECNTVLETSDTIGSNIEVILSSMAGYVNDRQGKFRTLAGAYSAPTITVNESYLAGDIDIQTQVPRRERFNTLKGKFADSRNNYQPTTYAPVFSNQMILDDGEEIIGNIDYPATITSQACQRLARIELLKTQQPLKAVLPCNMKALEIAPLSRINVTIGALGWVNKVFLVTDWTFNENGNGIDLAIQEDAAAIYDWNTSLEIAQDFAPNTVFSNPFLPPAPPSVPTFDETLVLTSSGDVGNRLDISWLPSASSFVDMYQLDYRLSTSGSWQNVATTSNLSASIIGIARGVYQFRVIAINNRGQRSGEEEAFAIYEVKGNTAPPANLTNFFLNDISANAHLTWDASPDLDVNFGGSIRLRHSRKTSGATWGEAIDITPALSGQSTSAVVPLLNGTYLLKAVNASGRESLAAVTLVVSNLTNVINMNFVVDNDQHPTFAGAKTNMIVTGGVLSLDGTILFDSVTGDFDDATGNFDSSGGGSSDIFQKSGEYVFSPVDLGSVYKSRVTIDINSLVENVTEVLDNAEGLLDDRLGLWDGDDITQISVEPYIRTTDDNPSGSPTWSDWNKFVVGDYTARGLQAKIVVTSQNATFNINIDFLSINIDVPDREEKANDIAVGTGGLTVTYSKPFFVAPALGVAIQNGATGDYATITSKTLSGFTINCYNAAGVGSAKTIDWIAKGY